MSSTRHKGSFSKRITVKTNDPEQSSITLKCEGRVLMPLELSPSRVNFGSISLGSPTQYRTISIYAGETGEIHPELVTGKYARVDAQICEIEPGQHYELQVSMGPPWKNGRVRETLRLKTGVEAAPEMSIHISSTIGDAKRRAASRARAQTRKQAPNRGSKRP